MPEVNKDQAFIQARQWMAIAGAHCIGGAKQNSERRIPVLDPATEQEIGNIAAGGAEEVDAAVAAARSCFESDAWQSLPPATREASTMYQVSSSRHTYGSRKSFVCPRKAGTSLITGFC